MSATLDRIDLKMLRLLQGNGRLSNAELAQLVGVSPATCHRRTQRLFEDGYVSHVRAAVAPQKVDRGALVMVGVVLDRSTPESFAEFEKAIAKLKFILAPDENVLRYERSCRQRASGLLKQQDKAPPTRVAVRAGVTTPARSART